MESLKLRFSIEFLQWHYQLLCDLCINCGLKTFIKPFKSKNSRANSCALLILYILYVLIIPAGCPKEDGLL